MDKIPFCFPVFYHGLIANRTIYSQPDVLNILISGRTENETSDWLKVDRITANKYINGTERISSERRKEIFALSDEKLLARIRKLNVQDIKTTISAFHAFLRERIQISEETVGSLEDSVWKYKDPYRYYVVALRESLFFTKAPKEYIIKELKIELQNLHKNSHAPDLFQLQKETLAQEEEAGNVLPTIVDTAVPMVVQGVMTILFADKNSSPAMIAQIQSGNFSSAIKSLASEGKLTAYDFYKWNNILKIAQKADSELGKGAIADPSEFDFDWFLRFFEAAGNIRADDMQQLWARVLAGEIKQPRSFSLRAVEVLRNMTTHEALAFKNAAALVLQESDGTIFLFCDTDLSDVSVNQKYGLSMGDILTLEEIGVISALRVDNEIEVNNEGADGFFNGSDLMILFESNDERSSTFHYRSYPLSEVGKQLLPIVREESNDDYLIDLGKILKEDLREKIDVCAYRVTSREGNDLELDFDTNLLDELS
ncbi:DUF2806 domain-containing protein [Acutalibacter sp. 1XD8-33]|uniref:DUF2806 domain-containing protein n=1 Tax=Acutalibacter sp. 1XD8-33 TaxID=2320081 RepID=UPI000EA09193|nr:DUF2806 domain-containing protein [Acutalibacter sp. 1XD8-33]RKJ41240.1 DUF2806 domain-containing protein [Acutalibacter sp. 1XD8-33]